MAFKFSKFNPLNWYFIYWIKSFIWIYNTPFKRPKFKVYFGERKMGTPYFLPRVTRKLTKEEKLKLIQQRIDNNPDKYKHTKHKDLLPLYNNTRTYVDRKFGIDLVPLGWKTKFDDIRHEYNPAISFVAFKKQLHIQLCFGDDPIENDSYWEAALFYKHETPKKESRNFRLTYCVFNKGVTWSTGGGSEKIKYFDYYTIFIKDKYFDED